MTLGDAAFAASGARRQRGWRCSFDEDRLQACCSALAFANVAGAAAISLAARRRACAPISAPRARGSISRLARRLAWSLYSVTATILLGQGVAFLVVGRRRPRGLRADRRHARLLRAAAHFLDVARQHAAARNLAAGGGRRRGGLAARCARPGPCAPAASALLYGDLGFAVLPHLHLRSLEHQPVMFVAVSAWALYAVVLAYLMPRILLETRMRFREIAVDHDASARPSASP